MPFTRKDLENLPISFEGKNEASVLVGPCSAKSWNENKIPLDGRHYICGGVVILKNGTELRASLALQTHTFDFLELDGVYVLYNDTWYKWDEKELLLALNEKSEKIYPFTWLPDKPLDYHLKGPYPMRFDQEKKFSGGGTGA